VLHRGAWYSLGNARLYRQRPFGSNAPESGLRYRRRELTG
jgi:hypothetical protein